MTRLSAFLLMIFAFVGTSSPQAQPDTPPPYLYYYAQLLGGLIIEHPDGSDSRQIAADVIPPNMTGLGGPGWSASGKYFAAYSIIYADYGGYRSTPYLIDVNGQSVTQWLYLVRTTSLMQWSPSGEDLLLVAGNFNSASAGNSLGSFIWLIDAQHNKVLSEFGVNVSSLAYSMSTITWDIDHKQILFYVQSDIYNIGDHYRVTLHFDGTILREPVGADTFIPMSESMNWDTNPDIRTGNNISPSGAYQARGSLHATLTDTRTNQTVELPIHTGATVCRDYIWSQDEQYMVTLNGTLIAGGGCAPAVMGITNPQAALWRELGGCSWNYPPCVGWLPPQVDVHTLPLGSPKPVQIDPVKIEYDAGAPVYMINPTKVRPLRLCCNKDSKVSILDTQTQTVVYTLRRTVSYPVFDISLPEQGIEIVAAEDPVHGLMATYTGWREVGVIIWKLDTEQDEYEPLIKLNTPGLTLEFTDNNEHLRARNFNGWKIYSVADILAAAKPQE